MSLTASEVTSLTATIERWEFWEYVCAGLVTIGCFGEFVAECTALFTNWIKDRKALAKYSALLLIAALAAELVCLVRTNHLSGMVIASLNEQAEEAKESARSFEGKIAESNRKAEEAKALSKNFEKDIASANNDSTQAKARASEAEKGATEAKLELAKFKAPRTLNVEQQNRLAAKLRAFSGTPYELAVVPIPEAMSLVGTMDAILRLSEWANKESAKKDFRNVFTSAAGSEIEQEYSSGFNIKATKAALVKYRAAIDALVGALKTEGIDARIELLKDDDPSPGNVHVAVGVKE